MLSLLTQLQTASKGITKAVDQYNTAGRKEAWKRATERAWQEHTDKAVDAYRQVMQGKGWMTTLQIECALGYARTAATPFLKKLRVELGLIERRNKDGETEYQRNKGYEYRWIQNGD